MNFIYNIYFKYFLPDKIQVIYIYRSMYIFSNT